MNENFSTSGYRVRPGVVKAGVGYFESRIPAAGESEAGVLTRPSGSHGILASFLSVQCNVCGLIGERNLYMFQFVHLLYDQMSVLF